MQVYNPIELAKYAVVKNIDDEPEFHQWVRDVFKSQNRMISKEKSK